jgi:alpha-N-acetylglucosamine transferase
MDFKFIVDERYEKQKYVNEEVVSVQCVRTVLFCFISGDWYINGIKAQQNQYRTLYLKWCLHEDFVTAQQEYEKVRKKPKASSSGSSKTKQDKKYSVVFTLD